MSERIALCIDETFCRNPEMVGLDGEHLESQSWLDVFTNGESARSGIRSGSGIAEAWVASCDDVEPINLAAAIKSDRPDLPVRLFVGEGHGSLLSRAHTAGIDEVVEFWGLPARYSEAKRRLAPRGAHAATSRPAGASGARPADTPTVLYAEPAIETRGIAAEPHGAAQLAFPVAPAPARKRGFIMPVVSGSGGAGKSSVAVMAALIAQNRGLRTLLLDYDLQFGDAAMMAGVQDPLAIDEAIEHPELLEREMRRAPSLMVIAAPSRLEKAEAVVHAMPAFIDQAASMFDVVVANTGAAWAEQHAVLLERSNAALFLIDQRASSIRACKHALELCARCGIATGPFEFALNRCEKGARLTSADVSSALQGAPVFEIREGGRDVEDYLGAGAAYDLLASGNPFSESLRPIMARILPGENLAPADDGRLGETRGAKRRGFGMGRKKPRRSGDGR